MMRELRDLELSQLCGQLLVVGFSGQTLPKRIAQALSSSSLGGVILFAENTTTARLAHEICQSVVQASPAPFPPWIAVDQEGGRVQRLREGVLQLPPMRVLGTHDDPALTERVAAELGRQLGCLGFNLDFAPVLDVDSNPKNPVIGDRSFGRSPQTVVAHARAFLRGLQSQGVAACIKHFPGHGDTAHDSHLELPSVGRDVVSLRQLELYPFERLAPEAWTAMTAHVLFPAFDSRPATLSPRLLDGLLRREFSFDGVLFSDDLEMGAMTHFAAIEQTAVLAVEAGCDALLVCHSEEAQRRAHEALIEAAGRDRAFHLRCVEAAERNLRARRRARPRPAKDWKDAQRTLDTASSRKLQRALDALVART